MRPPLSRHPILFGQVTDEAAGAANCEASTGVILHLLAETKGKWYRAQAAWGEPESLQAALEQLDPENACADSTLVALDGEQLRQRDWTGFEKTGAYHWDAADSTPLQERIVGLEELCMVLKPARYPSPLAALGNTDIRELELTGLPRQLQRTAEDFLAEPELANFCAGAYSRALDAQWSTDPAAYRWLSRTLDLVRGAFGESPEATAKPKAKLLIQRLESWTVGLSGEGPDLPWDALRPGTGLDPGWAVRAEHWTEIEPTALRTESDARPTEAELQLVEQLFNESLPAHFAASDAELNDASKAANGAAKNTPTGGPPKTLSRPGQTDVARRMLKGFGDGELLVVHAPTGTGKTLAYLVPALIFASRQNVRVGIATYTRALQEQAAEKDLPIALEMLKAHASPAAEARVAVWKGRSNYLCWRALRYARPSRNDGPEEHLAWTWACLFALADPSGDLDHFPPRAPSSCLAGDRQHEALQQLLRQIRATSGCCHSSKDRQRCGAELARMEAERAHVVLTNHALALARKDFFKNVIFDECEHLHDQAERAWSSELTFEQIDACLRRLHDPDRPNSYAPLTQLEGLHFGAGGARAQEALQIGLQGCDAVDTWTTALEVCVEDFLRWRTEAAQQCHPREEHALFTHYLANEVAEPMLHAREKLAQALGSLEGSLCALLEDIESLPVRKKGRLRRELELIRVELADLAAGLDAWIPLVDGQPSLDRGRFHDVETDGRNRRVLMARVLQPHEVLGRHYYPDLQSAAFLSAATVLRGGFETSLQYLGLARAAEPAEDEDRDGCAVATLRVPSPFDYGRVMVCIPDDAPRYDRRQPDFENYVGDFLRYLGQRTGGRILALFTNADDVRRVGRTLQPFFAQRGIPFWYQNMPGVPKEDLTRRFREQPNSILLGLDTFWFGADFAGQTLEYLVIARLPYGVPDRFHHAQCALMGSKAQRKHIYLPRALGKFRQGFGRLMRKESDRGVVFLLDQRLLTGAHRLFLHELPVETNAGLPSRLANIPGLAELTGLDPKSTGSRSSSEETERDASELDSDLLPNTSPARLITNSSESCLGEAFGWMNLNPPDSTSARTNLASFAQFQADQGHKGPIDAPKGKRKAFRRPNPGSSSKEDPQPPKEPHFPLDQLPF